MGKQPNDELIGKTLGQYAIIEEIGRGGMATVYRAHQQSMNRTVALKILPRTFLHDPNFFDRFTREVAVISQLEHPHILPVHDYGLVDGLPYIVMRYLAGGSLENRIRRGIPQLADLERPLRQICQALDYAHQHGVIHRDLKPGNILFDHDGNAYLSDFGIARVMGSDLTGSAVIGTPAYMSPEQARSQPLDGRSDVYSLAIVMFEWLAGKMPFVADTPVAMLLKQIEEKLPPIRQFRADIPPQVEAVIMRASAKNPSERFVSAGAFFEAFSQAIKGVSGSPSYGYAPPPPNPQPTPPYAPQPNRQPTPSYNTPPPQPTPYAQTPYYPPMPQPYGGYAPKKRRSMMPFLAIILLIIAVGVGVVIATRPSDTSTTTTTSTRRAPTSVRVPEGYVLYQGNDVQMAVPEDWQDVTTGEFINDSINTLQNVNPQLYNLMVQLRPQIEAGIFQIFAIELVSGVNVSIAVEQNPYTSLSQIESIVRAQYEQLGMNLISTDRVQLPVGEALHINASLPVGGGFTSYSEIYMVSANGRLYSVTFTDNSMTTEDWQDEFDIMIGTFSITS